MKTCAILHGAVFDCTLPTIGEKGYLLEHIVQWSVSSHRPDEKEDLEPDVKETIKFLGLLLELDPRKRISARAALASDFLAENVDMGSEQEEEEMEIL